ncbi:MAG TPA: flagellar hook-length control protein FliK [bacterium]|jgi:hypothetical protein
MVDMPFNVVNLNFALDIPPPTVAPAKAPDAVKAPEVSKTETFRKVLNRIGDREPPKATAKIAGKNQGDKHVGKSDGDPARTADTDSAGKTGHEGTQVTTGNSVDGDNSEADQSASEPSDVESNPQTPVTPEESPPAVISEVNFSEILSIADNLVVLPQIPVTGLPQPVTVSETPLAANPQPVVPSGTVPGFSQILGPEIEPDLPIQVPAADIDLPIPEIRIPQPIVPDRPLVRDNVPLVIPSTETESPELLFNQRTLNPIQTQRPEWTGLINFDELLDTSGNRDRDLSPQLDQVVRRNFSVTEPVIKPEPKGFQHGRDFSSRNFESRFNDPVIENPRVRIQNFAPSNPPPTVNAPQGNPLNYAFARNVFRGDVLNQSVNPITGTATESAQPLQARPLSQPLFSTVKFTPENIVSDVKEAVIRLASDGRGEARLVLHPPELGEIVVRLESARHGVFRVEFTTYSPVVREALSAGLDKLTDALKSEGLTLEHSDVNLNMQLGAGQSDGNPGQPSGDTFTASGDLPDINFVFDESDVIAGIEPLPYGSTLSVLA